ncbi:MAG: T9SS type A sorting domain-containing protein [Bacteroidetes bacterium]|nr:T9SS type A sorting domain-containing protein [Bacteroidota bacterium]
MKKILNLLTFSIWVSAACAQTTAMDFNRQDCNGTTRHLFTDLDSGKVVILEFFMGPNCQSCMDAATEIESLKAKLLIANPGKVMTYAIGFQNSYTCLTVTNWVSSQSLSAIPMDSGATQVAYYGGFSMPTIVAVAGTDHKIIYTANPNNGGYTNGDTSKIHTSVNNFFNPTGIGRNQSVVNDVAIYPNPASETITVKMGVTAQTETTIQVLNYIGQVVKHTENEQVNNGIVTKTIAVADLPSGSYLLCVHINGNTVVKSFNIVR